MSNIIYNGERLLQMVRYSDELLDEIKSKNDIVDIVSQYVVLKRAGRNYMGLCPFHKEKSGSFCVSPDKQIFHCFGCGVGGNVFHFISKIENLNFKESVEMLANRAGVELPVSGNFEDDKLAKLKSRVYEVNKCAAEFYHENLYKPTAKPGQEYVKKRHLDNKTLKAFKIGYSGRFNELYTELKSKGFTEEEILASCLVNKNPDGKFIDRFRNRLMFPIFDTHERVIAFGGRVLDDSKPKYINSPEDIVYSKGRHLFAFNIARKYNSKTIIMVEGYMDAVSLHQRGIHNAVASLGTALTEAQGRLLRRSCEKVIIGYDADGAGQAATLRGLEILQNLGCDIRILQIEGAKDPDEFVVKYGPERFQMYVDKAISLVEFKVKMLKKSLDLDNVNDKIKFLNEVAKIVAKVENSMEREVYVDKISLEYKVSKDAIYAEINKLLYANSRTEQKLEKKVVPVKSVSIQQDEQPVDVKTKRLESLVIYLLINYPDKSFERLKKLIDNNVIKIERNKAIINKLYEEHEKGNINIENILDLFEDEITVNYLSGIMSSDFEITDVDKCIEDVLVTYRKELLLQRRNEILGKIDNSNLTKEEVANLEAQLNEVIIQLAKIK
ncbi:dNA primase [Clostridium sp. CAG:245]|nr:dNA primase [Clostridium sp. CAG:245]